MKRNTVRLMLILLVTLMVTAGSRAEEIPDQPRAPQALDLYMKDTPLDTGIEPNPDTGPMWVTEDIWVRTSPDPNYQPQPFNEASPPWIPAAHENPEYRDPRLSTPNYVYIRIRNRGDAPSTGTERLRLTPTPLHTDKDMDHLVAAMTELWAKCPLQVEMGKQQAAE